MYNINLEINRIKNEEKRLKSYINKVEGNIQDIRRLNKEFKNEDVNIKIKVIIEYKNEMVEKHNKLLFIINTIENII